MEKMTERQQQVYDLIKAHPDWGQKQIAVELGITKCRVLQLVSRLAILGYISYEPKAKGSVLKVLE